MRAAIAKLPDGTYTHGFQTDGLDEPFTYNIAITVKGERILVDYAGTSPQVDRAINCTMTYTFAMTAYALKCALLPNLPNNEGIFRAIDVAAPEGSIVNPRFPAAVGGRMATGHYLPVAVFGALAPVLPDRLIAASGSPLWSLIQTGLRANGQTYANVLFFNGGMGATDSNDGQSTYAWPSNVSNVPVELIERNSPLFVHRKELRSAAAARAASAAGSARRSSSRSSPRPRRHHFHGRALSLSGPGNSGRAGRRAGEVRIDGAASTTARMSC